MKAEKIKLLSEAYKYCNDKEKSTEFMLEYMQDFAGVDMDDVLEFLSMKFKMSGFKNNNVC